MKNIKKFKNLFIVVGSILLFTVLRVAFGGSIVLYLVGAACGVGAYSALNYVEDKKQQKLHSSYEYQMQKLNETNENTLSFYTEQLEDLAREHDEFRYVVDEFIDKVASFAEKDVALNRLIQINDNNAKRFLQERSVATQSYIIANAKKLIKSLIAYSAQSRKNRPGSIEDVKAVQDVSKSMQGLTVNYDKLLDEVARMGDDFNPEDPGLKDVVENLQELRISTNVDDDDQAEVEQPITLNVTHSN